MHIRPHRNRREGTIASGDSRTRIYSILILVIMAAGIIGTGCFYYRLPDALRQEEP